MKKWYKNTNNYIILCFENFYKLLLITSLLLVSTSLLATQNLSEIAKIKNVSGHVFILNEGNVIPAKVGMRLYNFYEIMTDDSGTVSIVDYYDHEIHLSNSTHVVLKGRSLELINGYLLLQSFAIHDGFNIQTANSNIDYSIAEGIISFDSYAQKTQVVNIDGQFNLSNIFNKRAYVELKEGTFSFVSKNFKKGEPRTPTPIGYKSFLKIRNLFANVKLMNQKNKTYSPNLIKRRHRTRSIASVKNSKNSKNSKNIKYKLNNDFENFVRDRVSTNKRSKKLLSIYDAKLKTLLKNDINKNRNKNTHKRNSRKSNLVIRIFKANINYNNLKDRASSRSVNKRKPASITINKTSRNIKDDNLFERELKKQSSNKQRHSGEVNDLINELESIKIDNKKKY